MYTFAFHLGVVIHAYAGEMLGVDLTVLSFQVVTQIKSFHLLHAVCPVASLMSALLQKAGKGDELLDSLSVQAVGRDRCMHISKQGV